MVAVTPSRQTPVPYKNYTPGGGGVLPWYYVCAYCERPPFSALNFRSGAYHFHKWPKNPFRSIAILLFFFAVPGDHHFQNFFSFDPFIVAHGRLTAARSGSAPRLAAGQTRHIVSSGDPHFHARARSGAPHFHARARSGAPPPPPEPCNLRKTPFREFEWNTWLRGLRGCYGSTWLLRGLRGCYGVYVPLCFKTVALRGVSCGTDLGECVTALGINAIDPSKLINYSSRIWMSLCKHAHISKSIDYRVYRTDVEEGRVQFWNNKIHV